jgi:hypothetical protein
MACLLLASDHVDGGLATRVGTDDTVKQFRVGDVFRARLIVTLADDLPYRTIQELLGTTAGRDLVFTH